MEDQLPPRPEFSSAEALRIAEAHFGISATRALPLPSDRDQNFALLDEGSRRKYVLKLAHLGEDPQVLDLQNRMLEHLTRGGFPLSNVLFAKNREEVVGVPGEAGSIFLTRLLSWLPGIPLYQVRPKSPTLLQSLGAFLGGMDRALEDFSHPAQDRELKWDLKQAADGGPDPPRAGGIRRAPEPPGACLEAFPGAVGSPGL